MAKDNKTTSKDKSDSILNNFRLPQKTRETIHDLYNHNTKKYDFLGINSISKFFNKIKSFFKNLFKNIKFSRQADPFIEAEDVPPPISENSKKTKNFERASLREARGRQVVVERNKITNKPPQTETVLNKYLAFQKTISNKTFAQSPKPITDFFTEQMFKGKVSIGDISSILSYSSTSRVTFNEKTEKFAFTFIADNQQGVIEVDLKGNLSIPETINDKPNIFATEEYDYSSYENSVKNTLDSIDFDALTYIIADNKIVSANIKGISDFLEVNKEEIGEELYGKCQNIINGIKSNYSNDKFILAINRAFNDVVNDPSLSIAEKLQHGLVKPNNTIKNLKNPLQYHVVHILNERVSQTLGNDVNSHSIASQLFNKIDASKFENNFTVNPVYASYLMNNISSLISEHNMSIEMIPQFVSPYINSNDISTFNINSSVMLSRLQTIEKRLEAEQEAGTKLEPKEFVVKAMAEVDLSALPNSIDLEMMQSRIKEVVAEFEKTLTDSGEKYNFPPDFFVYVSALQPVQLIEMDFTPLQEKVVVDLLERVDSEKSQKLQNGFDDKRASLETTTSTKTTKSTPEVVDIR